MLRFSVPILPALLLAVLGGSAQNSPASVAPTSAPVWKVRLDIDSTEDSIHVTDCDADYKCASRTHLLVTASAGVKADRKTFHLGDHL